METYDLKGGEGQTNQYDRAKNNDIEFEKHTTSRTSSRTFRHGMQFDHGCEDNS